MVCLCCVLWTGNGSFGLLGFGLKTHADSGKATEAERQRGFA